MPDESDYPDGFDQAWIAKRKTMKANHILTAAALVAGLAFAAPAFADSTGFDKIHSVVRIGGKTCFADHSHGGSGSGATRKIAEMQAVQSWYGYTAGEYGSDWSNINKAVKRSMRCAPAGGGSWNCDVEATPCR
jgi:hypothetical protein